ncbi:hypothetical protein [Croceimicrobium hydrocarbonivorans]|uniref:Outer membrane protein beta-barrel domain-containing protein n=1 Tax=Croceimicrobium hydrocarbonivorans TaxID=2761580 RepID=A0A7H0VFT2_9FLAO|nr:hypothetical protein [Croceimicrobium hydrocarbonivorans]QNR24580.1 hypothetical protein H4K34_01695 [Croceimicrobium hydrocarbonivorans]
MAKDPNIDRKIRESFESAEFKAPEGIWQALDQSMSAGESQMDQKVKDSFEAQNAAAPESVWEGINRQLTIDKAWKGIDSYLNRQRLYRVLGRVAAILLLLFSIGWWWSNTGPSKAIVDEPTPMHSEEQIQKSDQPQEMLAPSELSHSPINGNQEQPANAKEPSFVLSPISGGNGSKGIALHANQQIGANADAEQVLLTEQSSDDAISQAELELKDWFDLGLEMPSLVLMERDFEPKPQFRTHPKTRFKAWQMGLRYSWQRDYLSNSLFRESLDPRSLVRSNAVYSSAISAELYYRLNPTWSVNLMWQQSRDWVFHYNTYEEGQYVDRKLELNYRRIGIGLNHHFRFGPQSKWPVLSMGVQPYYGFLNQATEAGINQTGSYTDAWGMELRIGQEWKSGDLLLYYGLATDFSLNNLYKGTDRIPADFNRTLYRSWGLYIGTRYGF